MMRLTTWDMMVLNTVWHLRLNRIATTKQVAGMLVCDSSESHQVFSTLDNLETAGYLESALVISNSVQGDVRCWMLTEKAEQLLHSGG
jgi:hypothetical protein